MNHSICVLQVIKMLVAVIVIFVLCWAPLLISNVLTAFGVMHHLNYGSLKPMRQTFYLLAYFNSCVNPVVYGFMSRHFRQTFLHTVCMCLKGRQYARAMMLQRQGSCATRTSHLAGGASGMHGVYQYSCSKAGSDLELTVIDVTSTCGNGVNNGGSQV
jgi:hypothetical protein